SVALDEATAARRAQPRAQRLGRFASICRNADAMPDRGVAHGRAHDEQLTAAEDRRIFLLQLRVSGKRVALQTIADELNRPAGAWRRRRARAAGAGFARSAQTEADTAPYWHHLGWKSSPCSQAGRERPK